jgi:hypothetical protein
VRNADRIAGAALLALAIAFSAGALKYYTYWGPGGPGSAFLPFWLGVVMAVLASLMLAGPRRARDTGAEEMPRGVGFKRVLMVLVVTIAFVALLNAVGMVLGTALFLIAMMRLLDRNPWPLTLAVAVAAAGFNYLVFTLWLRVPFPVSPFGF